MISLAAVIDPLKPFASKAVKDNFRSQPVMILSFSRNDATNAIVTDTNTGQCLYEVHTGKPPANLEFIASTTTIRRTTPQNEGSETVSKIEWGYEAASSRFLMDPANNANHWQNIDQFLAPHRLLSK